MPTDDKDRLAQLADRTKQLDDASKRPPKCGSAWPQKWRKSGKQIGFDRNLSPQRRSPEGRGAANRVAHDLALHRASWLLDFDGAVIRATQALPGRLQFAAKLGFMTPTDKHYHARATSAFIASKSSGIDPMRGVFARSAVVKPLVLVIRTRSSSL
jgi:hypothetical protein